MIGGLVAFVLVMLIELVPVSRSFRGRWLILPVGSACWLALVVLGISLDLVSSTAGTAQGGRTGKNLYQCDADAARPGVSLSIAIIFARSSTFFPSTLRNVALCCLMSCGSFAIMKFAMSSSPSDPSEAASSAFLDQTLALARDPSAWPILVHCHGCMDRSPAWMGIYRFVVQDRPLIEIMQEIERHRGYRPKASVTLLYNRVLPPRAGARYWADPTATLLRQCAAVSRTR